MTTNTSTTNKSSPRARNLADSSTSMDDDGDTDTSSTTGSVADKLLGNEMRAHKNRGFHDGYDAGKKSTLQKAYDGGYKKAFEQNFILSTLKGVANALKSSHRNHMQQISAGHQSQSRPTSAISAMSTSPAPKLSSGGGGGFVRRASSIITSSTSDTHDDEDHQHHHHHHHHGRRRHHHNHNDVTRSNRPSESSLAPSPASPLASTSSSSSRRRQSSPYAQAAGSQGASAASSVAGGDDVASTCSSSSISSNRSSTAGCYSSTNVSISSNHLSLLDSMKFDATSDIESIKKDLIKICRENRLEILAHYVSQIG